MMRLTPKFFLRGTVLAAIISAAGVAQWAVDRRAPMYVQPSGAVTSVYYGPVNQPTMMTRLMPSESRYLTSASGYLPSENRMMRQEAGLLPSQGSAAHLMPQSLALTRNPLPVSAYVPNSTVRYSRGVSRSSPYPYAPAVTPTFVPTATTRLSPTVLSSVSPASVTNRSIRYGNINRSFSYESPTAANVPLFHSSAPPSGPASASLSSGLPAASSASSFSSSFAYPPLNQSIRYRPSGTRFVPP